MDIVDGNSNEITAGALELEFKTRIGKPPASTQNTSLFRRKIKISGLTTNKMLETPELLKI